MKPRLRPGPEVPDSLSLGCRFIAHDHLAYLNVMCRLEFALSIPRPQSVTSPDASHGVTPRLRSELMTFRRVPSADNQRESVRQMRVVWETVEGGVSDDGNG
jgi:hypothetical protein